jgi:hypothetical protein
LYEALEIVVLGNRSVIVHRDVTEYLRFTERIEPQPKGSQSKGKWRYKLAPKVYSL